MANQRIGFGLALVLVAMLWTGATAQSSSCTSVLISLTPCLSYITGNSSTASSNCCTQLANVVQSQPECLCQVLNGGASALGLNINQTQALTLPTVCNVQTPSISNCNAATPADSPAGSKDTPTVPSDGSNDTPSTVPATDTGSSDGVSLKTSSTQLLLLVVASLAAALIG
uniref:Bifunctional inhibitor/plant lipid transfer protein/seed storage helical domain-containing protein n=1 Tax=Kalanchoe fedtschenkoi TaxID=63787 RepID=A0A7N0V663_KALFE